MVQSVARTSSMTPLPKSRSFWAALTATVMIIVASASRAAACAESSGPCGRRRSPNRLVPALLAAGLIGTPTATATWSAHGAFEPNTNYDSSSFMWEDPPGEAKRRIYFQAITMAREQATGARFNPNVGALQTQFETPANEFHEAILGVWTDCNRDGYVGMAETAVREYPDVLLLDKTLCPPSFGPPNSWSGQHNHRGYVTELIPIARYPSPRDARVWRDDSAKVWGDYHRPDEKPTLRMCPLTAFPRETWSNTGGLLNYIDCRTDVIDSTNDAFDLVGDPLGLKFADESDARTGPIGQVSPFGTDDSEHSAVYVADCSRDPVLLFPLLPGTDLIILPLPPNIIGNTNEPTAAATWDQAQALVSGDCTPEDGGGVAFYGGVLPESDFITVDPENKRAANWNFNFVTQNRGEFPMSLVPGGAGSAGGPGPDAGLHVGGSRWVSDSTYMTKPGWGIVRANLEPSDPGFDIADAYWLTFYAYVSGNTLARGVSLPGGTGYYGSWHCGTNDLGIHNGWNCDADAWYVNPDGSTIPNTEDKARPNQPYQLRDVDCYDGGIGDTGIGIQPSYYGPNPCPYSWSDNVN